MEMNKLKNAEKDASAIVAEARSYRVTKMRDAKVGAEEAITSYAKELSADYDKQAATRQSKDGGLRDLDSSTDKDIAVLGRDFNAKKEEVAQMLVDMVTSV